ncbi:MAG: extracellular solute-binding protein, partial [Phycisphaeraceae bacterium]
SVFELTDPKWAGRVGWAPPNGSFQAFVTAMRYMHGDDKTREWLLAMKENNPKAYPKNTPILTALAGGEIDIAITNHYYLLRFKQEDPNFPVAQTMFEPGDVGNLMLVAGVGMLDTATNIEPAEKFISFLLSSDAASAAFAAENFEYPVSVDAPTREELPAQDRLGELAPEVPLDALDDLEGTLDLLREVGLL